MAKEKLYIDIIAHNNKNRAKLEYNQMVYSGTLADGYYENVHPKQGWKSKFTITGNTCVCDYYDKDDNLVSHSEYTDLTPGEWPKPDFDPEMYEIIDIRGLQDDIEEI